MLAGLRHGQQAAQQVVQAQLLRRAEWLGLAFGGDEAAVDFDKGGLAAVAGQSALLQRIEQGLPRSVGLGGPLLQQGGLLAGSGADEVSGVASLGGQWQQECQ